MTFDKAFEYTMPFEGWDAYTNDPDDKGGATKYGITVRTLTAIRFDVDGDGDVTENDVKSLTYSQAKDILKRKYWDMIQADSIESERIAIKLFDCAVNMGPARATRIAQEALNDLRCGLVVDGLMGPKTLSSLNGSDEDVFFLFLVCRLEQYYVGLNQRKFLKGWLRRARTLPK